MFAEILRMRATSAPKSIAFAFLGDGENITESLTYLELDQRATAVAARLQQQCKNGDRVLLLLPQGLNFIAAFFGCLRAGVIAVPAPPLDPVRLKRTLPRVSSILDDALPALVLTNEEATSKLIEALAERSILTGQVAPTCLSIQDIVGGERFKLNRVQVETGDTAYLQYSSGSTGAPKGIRITHGNLLAHAEAVRAAWHYDESSVGVSWMPQFHDYGLIDALVQPVFSGFPCYVMSPVSFIRRPARWLRAISRLRATHTQAPNFAYETCVHKVEPDPSLDLRSLRVASNGAEPVRAQTLQAFAQRFAPCGLNPRALFPAYGLAEATLLVTTASAWRADGSPMGAPSGSIGSTLIPSRDANLGAGYFVSCGRPVLNTDICIVNPQNSEPCVDGTVGEIWVRGPGVAAGYWGRDDDSRQVFQAVTADGDGPYLRTGDLGFLCDGELCVTGRCKDLIVIDGANHYPQDIEWTLEHCHALVRDNGTAAFSIEVGGEERLAVLVELESLQANTSDLLEVIRSAIAERHELKVHTVAFLRKGAIHKTSSGKLQRQANRQSLMARRFEVIGGVNCE